MIKRIFKNTFWVSMVTLLIAYVIIVGILYDYFDRQIKTELKTEAEYIACGIESVGEEYLDSFDQNRYVSDKVDASQAHKNRITWVDSDGTVLFDSDADKEQMENHKDRAEIQSALKDGEGYTVRYSHTLDEQTIYYAVELPDGSVLRVSSAYNTVVAIIMAMMQPTLFLVLLIIVLSYLMSKSVAKRIVAPINNMDLMYGEMDEEYEELVPLLKRIRKQNILIDEQMDDLKTQQAKFQALTEHMREGFLVLDKKENVMSYNKAAVELLGASKDMDYTGHNVIQFDRERSLREAVDEAINGVRTQRTLENGDRIYRIVANPIVIQDVVKDETVEEEAPKADTVPKDQVEGAVVIILDETEKEKREQLRREFTSNVSLHIVGDDVVMDGVPSMVEEVVYNLCDNGIKYNKKGGRVAITLQQVTEQDISYAVIEVADTGIGIAQDDQERVFERFYRVDKSHSKAIGGTGLGLSIVKHVVLFHHGHIKISSVPGEGTTITVFLPIHYTAE